MLDKSTYPISCFVLFIYDFFVVFCHFGGHLGPIFGCLGLFLASNLTQNCDQSDKTDRA